MNSVQPGRRFHLYVPTAVKQYHAVTAIRWWVEQVAEHIPNDRAVRLPFRTKIQFWRLYKSDAELRGEEVQAAGYKLFCSALQVLSHYLVDSVHDLRVVEFTPTIIAVLRLSDSACFLT